MWDLHAHMIPPTVLDAAKRGLYGMELDDKWLYVSGHRVPSRGRMFDIEALEDYAVSHHLALMLSVPPILIRDDLGGQSDWHSFLNQALTEVSNQLSVETRCLAVLPLAEPRLALSLWERIGGDFCGVALGAGVHGRGLADEGVTEFWDGFARVGGGLAFIHGGEHADPRLVPYYLSNLVGYPYEDMLATATLVLSGLPVRYPTVRWLISHGGGGAAFLLGRWQHGFDTRRPGINHAGPPPDEVFGQLWFDSVVHDPRALRFLLDMVPDRVVFGTDYPFPMGTQHLLEAGLAPEVLSALNANGETLMNLVTKGRKSA